MNGKTIAVDFDGTISEYFGWRGPFKFGPPLEGIKEFLEELKSRGYYVLVYSCRPTNERIQGAMEKYMERHSLPFDSIFSHGFKPAAHAYVDDRGISCQPQKYGKVAFEKALEDLTELEAYKAKEKIRCATS